MNERKPYEKPAVIFEKELEALAADCDPDNQGINNIFQGGWNCKGAGPCAVTAS